MPNVPYPYEVNGKLVVGNGSLRRRYLANLKVHRTKIWGVAVFHQNPQKYYVLSMWY
jgi:hypothetical protein